MTETLRDFRTYRPSAQRTYLEFLESRSITLGLTNFVKQGLSSGTTVGVESMALYALMVDQNREFRERHWRFTKEYIIKRSDYPIATGGSPIVSLSFLFFSTHFCSKRGIDIKNDVHDQLSYLPQNLTAVLDLLNESCDSLSTSSVTSLLSPDLARKIEIVRERALIQRRLLVKDINDLKSKATEGIDDKRASFVKGAVGCDGVG